MPVTPATDEALFALQDRIAALRNGDRLTLPSLIMPCDEVEALLERIKEEIGLRDTALWLSDLPTGFDGGLDVGGPDFTAKGAIIGGVLVEFDGLEKTSDEDQSFEVTFTPVDGAKL